MRLNELARIVTGTMERFEIPYYITGSVAGFAYGRYRTTNDVDIVAEFPSTKVREFCSCFPLPDWYVSVEAALQAIGRGGMFNILHSPSGFKADIIDLRGRPFDLSCKARAKRLAFPEGGDALFSSPEDLILNKLLFLKEGGSQRHVDDIAEMYKHTGAEFDLAYIEQWAARLRVTEEWNLAKSKFPKP